MVASKRGISEGGLDQHENELFKLLDLVSESDVRQDKVKVKPEGFEVSYQKMTIKSKTEVQFNLNL